MFDPKTFSKASFEKENERKMQNIIKDALRVMNFLKFSEEDMRKFKSGVNYSARIDRASYSINYNAVKTATDFYKSGKSRKYIYGYFMFDNDEVKFVLVKRDGTTKYLTYREGKIVLVDLHQ